MERRLHLRGSNELWLTGIIKEPIADGKLYLGAVTDIYSGRNVGYSMDTRMNPLRPSPHQSTQHGHGVRKQPREFKPRATFRPRRFVKSLRHPRLSGSMGRRARARTTPQWSPSSRCYARTSSTAGGGSLCRNAGDNTIWIERTFHHRRRQSWLGKHTSVELATNQPDRAHSGPRPQSKKAGAVPKRQGGRKSRA